jgi:F-type H+-transporting ATPase subunit delta
LAIARRYAKALLLIGQQDGQTERYRNELSRSPGWWRGTACWTRPSTTLCTKARPASACCNLIAKLKFSKAMESFLILLFEKGRFGFWSTSTTSIRIWRMN